MFGFKTSVKTEKTRRLASWFRNLSFLGARIRLESVSLVLPDKSVVKNVGDQKKSYTVNLNFLENGTNCNKSYPASKGSTNDFLILYKD